MTHYYEKNIVEIKHEYTECLLDITTPFIYEGIKHMYDYSRGAHRKLLKKQEEINSNKKIKGPLEIFQLCLADIENTSNSKMENEVNRIKSKSKSNCADWYDDLVKAVIKSNIILLTYTTSKNKSELVERRFHETIKTSDFIHRCYVSCAEIFYNNPEIFYHGYHSLKVKENQREICNIIEKGIKNAIRKMLPMKLILTEYNSNDYLTESEPSAKYENIKDKLNQDASNLTNSRIEETSLHRTKSNENNTDDQVDNYEEIDDTDIVDEIINSDDDSEHRADASSILTKITSMDHKMNVENDVKLNKSNTNNNKTNKKQKKKQKKE